MATRAEITVEGSAPDIQPETFRCCPLGVQFYSSEELPLYKVMAMSLNLPSSKGPAEKFEATGVVVQSRFEPVRNQHRIWIMFADLPDSVAAKLKCISKETGSQCPHCMNY